MKILDKYCIKESLSYFMIALCSFTTVLLTIRMLKFAALIVDKGVEFSQIAFVFLAIIPTFLEIALPLSALLGVLLAYSRLSGDSEIVVLRASGVSLYQLLVPAIIFGSIVLIAAFSVSLYFKQKGYSLLSATLFDIARSKTTSGLEEGIFNRLNVVTIYADQIDDQTGALKKVVLDDRRDPEIRRIIFAKNGEIMADSARQIITFRLNDGEIHEKISGKYSRTNFSSNSIQLNSSELLEGSSREKSQSINELNLAQLSGTIDYLKKTVALSEHADPVLPEMLNEVRPSWMAAEQFTKKEAYKRLRRAEIEKQSRFSLPFASFILALLALPLGIQPSRAQKTWGVGLSVITGMIVFVIYYGLFSIGVVMAQSGSLPSFIALWIPNIAALLVSIFFLKKLASESWQSVADLIDVLKNFISALFPGDKKLSVMN